MIRIPITLDLILLPDLTNAIKVKRGKETYLYRTNHAEDKRALLMAFRQVAEELREKKREQTEREQDRRKSMWTGEVRSTQGGMFIS